ncbi:lysozyme inhibitor LprI family protein [Paraburkholderia sp. J94]|uniref:lysozyme inhibitor LprI family protein n=1 Tax=Paraburkholderia sp. J94 TaxID=2805441 RepID=UPI002AB05A5B|nr:lysozyme inhibitor LprI family protein [Paraburkholderia sp. J94]
MNWKQILLLSSSAISLNAFALDCNAPSGGIGPDAAQSNLQCAEQERTAADHALNGTYKKLLANLKNDPREQRFSRTQIVAAQRAWAAFRDAECEFRTSLSGSAPQWVPVYRTQCLTELTTARVEVLGSA